MATLLPSLTVVASAALPRWWITTPLLSKPPVRVLAPWAITTAGEPVPVPASRVTVRDPVVLGCWAVLTTMALPKPLVVVVGMVIVVDEPPVTVSATSPATPLSQAPGATS